MMRPVVLALCAQVALCARTRLDRLAKADCEALANMQVKGKKFGNVAKFVCQYWPKGEFPVNDALKYEELINTGLKPGGVWELLDRAKAANEGNFCWRRTSLKKGDSCSRGFTPTALSGVFKRVCTSACTETDYPVGCALGCSKSKISCALTVIDQIKAVADIAGKIKEEGTDDLEGLATAFLDEVRAISDFALDVLKRVKETGDRIYAEQDSDSKIALIMTLVYTFSAEKEGLLNDAAKLKNMISSVSKMVYDIMDGDFTAGGVAKVVVKFGQSVLQQAISLSNPFTSRICKKIDKKVVFTIEEAGDEEVIGPYIDNGKRDGRPKYIKVGNSRIGVEYSGRQHKWRFYKGSLTGIFSDNLYLADVTSENYPSTGWYAKDGAEPAPEVITVKQP